MPPPDDGTAAFDGLTEPAHADSSTSSDETRGVGREAASDYPVHRLIADLGLHPSRKPGALGRLGHYDILSVVGAGAMGVVLRAFDEQLKRTVAIKVLSSHLIQSEQARRRFVREAQSAAQLNHPNVVTIHGVDYHNGVPFLVMEFVDGVSLQQRIACSAPMFTIDILRLSQQIAIGLSAAHRSGVVHRDIKPANIMLEDRAGRVKITDFGLAKVAMGNSDLTSLGKMIGTPSYMSPEQVSGDPLDGRSDLYSLGCVMYSMVAGGPPFRGENCLAVAHRIRTESPGPLRDKHSAVPRFLEEIILRLLEKDPERRFQSADELAAVLAQRLVMANPGGSSSGLPDTAPTRLLDAPVARPSVKSKRITIGALVACVAVLLAAFSLRMPDPPPGDLPPPPPIPDRPKLTVRRDGGEADAATISQALSLVKKPWTVIEVLDDSLYHEAISISGPNHRGLRLIANERATLQHTPDQMAKDIFSTEALIDIDSVSNVTIEGFQLRPGAVQWGIRIRGNCPGLDISKIRSNHPPDAERVFLYGHLGASGSAEQPIRLHHLVISCGSGAFYFTANVEEAGRPGSGNPIGDIEIEDNLISGTSQSDLLNFTEVPGRSLPSHLRINVRHNLVVGGKAGVNLYPTHPEAFDSVNITNNTFSDLGTLISTIGDQIPSNQLRFDSNLILNTDQVIDFGRGSAKKSWFHNTHWELSPTCNRSAIEDVATPHPVILMESREIGNPGYMHPQSGAVPEIEGPFPGAYDRSSKEASETLPTDGSTH